MEPAGAKTTLGVCDTVSNYLFTYPTWQIAPRVFEERGSPGLVTVEFVKTVKTTLIEMPAAIPKLSHCI